jgi:hypothetical protein
MVKNNSVWTKEGDRYRQPCHFLFISIRWNERIGEDQMYERVR